jgi:hypothetical protein
MKPRASEGRRRGRCASRRGLARGVLWAGLVLVVVGAGGCGGLFTPLISTDFEVSVGEQVAQDVRKE